MNALNWVLLGASITALGYGMLWVSGIIAVLFLITFNPASLLP